MKHKGRTRSGRRAEVTSCGDRSQNAPMPARPTFRATTGLRKVLVVGSGENGLDPRRSARAEVLTGSNDSVSPAFHTRERNHGAPPSLRVLESIQDPPRITVAAFVDEFAFSSVPRRPLDDGLNNVAMLVRKPFLPDPEPARRDPLDPRKLGTGAAWSVGKRPPIDSFARRAALRGGLQIARHVLEADSEPSVRRFVCARGGGYEFPDPPVESHDFRRRRASAPRLTTSGATTVTPHKSTAPQANAENLGDEPLATRAPFSPHQFGPGVTRCRAQEGIGHIDEVSREAVQEKARRAASIPTCRSSREHAGSTRRSAGPRERGTAVSSSAMTRTASRRLARPICPAWSRGRGAQGVA